MAKIIGGFWRVILRQAPTSSIQEALRGRPDVDAFFVPPGEMRSVDARGVCWVLISEN